MVLKSPLDARDTAGAKQRFIEILRRKLNRRIKDPAREGQWDFWSEGSTRYALETGKRAYLLSFRRTSRASQEGFLVIGSISGQDTVVRGYWRVPAGIDDIHVVDMGKAGPMIYTVSFDTTAQRRLIYHHLLRFDGKHISEVWSYTFSYDVKQRRTYKPVSVTFRDEDRDGTREVRLRIPGKDTPKLWKRRWAIYKWNAAANEFRPLKGLAFTPVSLQKPLWAAFGYLEAIRTRSRTDARRFTADERPCRSEEALWDVLQPKRYKPVGELRRKGRVNAFKDRRATILVDLEKTGDPRRYQAELHLVRHGPLNGWRVCTVRFFRL